MRVIILIILLSSALYARNLFYLMGTYAIVDLPSLEKTYEAYKILLKVEKKISDHLEKSEISRINKMAGVEPVAVSDITLSLIKKSVEVSELTDGVFDITVGAITINHKREGKITLQEAKKLVDYEKIRIDGKKVFLIEKNMAIDTGGIGKGFALDVVRRLIATERGFISIGGEMLLWGQSKSLAVRNPFKGKPEPMIQMEAVRDLCISTSANYHRRHIEKRDPDLVQVTVVYPECTLADALATALFAADYFQRREIIRKVGHLGVVEVYSDGSLWFSREFFGYFGTVYIRY